MYDKMDAKLIIVGLLMSMLMLCNFNKNCLRENFTLGAGVMGHIKHLDECDSPHMMKSVSTQPYKHLAVETRAGHPLGAMHAVNNPVPKGNPQSACPGNHGADQLEDCNEHGYNVKPLMEQYEDEPKTEENFVETVNIERIMTAHLNNRNKEILILSEEISQSKSVTKDGLTQV